MEIITPPIEDLRNSVRYNINNIPISLVANEIHDVIPARLKNVSLGGFQILCSRYVSRQLSKPKYSLDGPMRIIVKILDKDDLKASEFSCKLVYIHQNHLPNEYCSDAVGLKALMDNPEDKRVLSRFIEINT